MRKEWRQCSSWRFVSGAGAQINSVNPFRTPTHIELHANSAYKEELPLRTKSMTATHHSECEISTTLDDNSFICRKVGRKRP